MNIPQFKKTKSTMVEDFINKPVEFFVGNSGKQNLDIETYKNKFLGANARSYLFICKVQFPGMQNALVSGLQTAISNPSNISEMVKKGLISAGTTAIETHNTSSGTEDFKYFVKSTTLPESSIEETTSYWAGQQIKYSSVRRTTDWEVTFLVNNDASIIRKFWEWHLILHNPETNMYGNPTDYMCDQTIQLLGLDGSVICNYKLFGAWPKQIGQVSLDYSSNEFAEIAITFAYQYHTITETGEPGGMAIARKIGQNVIVPHKIK